MPDRSPIMASVTAATTTQLISCVCLRLSNGTLPSAFRVVELVELRRDHAGPCLP